MINLDDNNQPVSPEIGKIRIKDFSDMSYTACLLYTSPSPRDANESRMPSSA